MSSRNEQLGVGAASRNSLWRELASDRPTVLIGVRKLAAPRDTQRIAKLLARAGIASRREIERMIAEGRIAIDGKPVETPATLLTSLHGVTVDGKPVKAAAPARLFRYHKPAGLLTAERDPKGRPTIYDRLPQGLPRLMPVGRLDMNTEGLLLLTTDGELKRQLELPATGVERSYRARAFGHVTQDQLEDLIHGIEIEGVRYGAIDANLERRTGRNQWIEMRLREGKNREVRRVLEHMDLKVSRLIRTAYGPFELGDLPAGAVDEVRQHDLVAFRKILGSIFHDTERTSAAARPPEGIAQGERPAAKRSEPSAKAGGATRERPPRKRDEQPVPRPAGDDRVRTGPGQPEAAPTARRLDTPPALQETIGFGPSGSPTPRRPRDGSNIPRSAGDNRVRTAPGSPKGRRPRDGSTTPRSAGDDRVRTSRQPDAAPAARRL